MNLEVAHSRPYAEVPAQGSHRQETRAMKPQRREGRRGTQYTSSPLCVHRVSAVLSTRWKRIEVPTISSDAGDLALCVTSPTCL